MGFLEETLAHLCHRLLVFADLLRDTHKHSEFRWQVDVLALLLDFKEGLIHLQNLLVILLFEVGRHRNGRAGFSLLEVAGLGAHVESDIADFVSLMVAVAGHDDGALELINDGFLEFLDLWGVVGVAEAFLTEALHLLVNQL